MRRPRLAVSSDLLGQHRFGGIVSSDLLGQLLITLDVRHGGDADFREQMLTRALHPVRDRVPDRAESSPTTRFSTSAAETG